jgi:hypothetical protein
MHTFEIGHPDGHTHVPIDMSGAVAQLGAHVPLQHTSPVAHGVVPHTHCEFTQVEPAPQALPQLPQLLMSDARLLQPLLPQQLWPVPHGTPFGRQPHCPFWHTVPDAHWVPQPPQFCASIIVLMHTEPQHLPGHWFGLSGQMSCFGMPRSGGGTPCAQAASATARRSR